MTPFTSFNLPPGPCTIERLKIAGQEMIFDLPIELKENHQLVISFECDRRLIVYYHDSTIEHDATGGALIAQPTNKGELPL